MPHFTIAEPHPTVGQNSYMHSGRGGAGNYFRAPATTPAAGIATSPKATSSSSSATAKTTSNFYSGRGGAGNAHVSTTRPVMSFDEELRIQSQMEQKRVGYVGRGGAGNIYDAARPRSPRRKDSDGASSTSSAGSFIDRVSSAFSRR